MTPVIQTLIWAALGGLFVWRLDVFANRWLDQKEQRTKVPEQLVIPDDLAALILSEDGGTPEATKHAQRAVEDAIRDRYATYGDWNKVRRALGIGELN